MFHVGIEIGGNFTDCLLIDQADQAALARLSLTGRSGHWLEHKVIRIQVIRAPRARAGPAGAVVSLLTEIVWSDVLPRVRPALRAAIGGEHAVEPSPRAGSVPRLANDRYASMAEVMRLLRVPDSARNVFAAFFLGDVVRPPGR